MDQFFKIWLLLVLALGFPCLMYWVHRSFLKGMLSMMAVIVAAVPIIYIIMIPMSFLAHFLSSFFAENLRDGAFAGISTFGTGVFTAALFVWYCVSQREISGFTSAPVNAYRTSSGRYTNSFGRRIIR